MRDICIFCWQPDMSTRNPSRKCGSCGFELYHLHNCEYEYRLPGQPGLWQEIPEGTLLIVTEESA